MANGTLQALIQQAGVLSLEDKRALTAWLHEQMKLDAAPVKLGEPPLPPSEEPDPFRRREMRWLSEPDHQEKYAGQYVALWGDTLVAHGTDAGNVLATARALGKPRALMARVDALDELPFGGW